MTTHSDRPWMTALEMQFAAMKLMVHFGANPNGETPEKRDRLGRAYRAASSFLRISETFAWTDTAARAASVAAETIPDTSMFANDLLPDGMRAAFWWFEKPLPLLTLFDGAYPTGMLIGQGDDGPWFLMVFREGPITVGAFTLPLGTTLQATLADVEQNPAFTKYGKVIRFVLASCAWLKQRIAVVERTPLERHARKRLQREQGIEIHDIKVIRLRRAESLARVEGSHGEPVEWSCRWVVNGHWRNQYHPSDGKHELQYILPYVKGPEDKPLRIPSHTVYAVNR
jgi:hypothetical protein